MKKLISMLILCTVLLVIAMPAPKPAYARGDIDGLCKRLGERIASNGNRIPEDILHPKTAIKTWTKAKIMVCLLQFPDIKPQLEPEFLVSRFQGTGATEPSLEEYYGTTSGGVFDIDFGPEGVKPVWVKMPKPIQSYTMTKFDYGCVPGVLNDAVKAAYASGLNPEDYDLDGNGFPEFFIMVFSGNSWTTGGPVPGDFMSSYEGLTWIMVGEDVLKNKNYDLQFSPITLYHEFSHCLGIADLYDHTYKKGSPVGGWDIMGDGVWRGYCGMNAFNREKLGWCTIKDISEAGVYEIDDLDSVSSNKAYRVPIPGGANEFIIIENRQRVDRGYCKSSPGSGLVFYHWNANRAYTNDYNDTIPNKSIGISVISLKPQKYFLDAFFSQDCGRDRLDLSTSADVASWFTNKKEVSLIFRNISKAGKKMTFEIDYLKPIEPTIEVQKVLDFGMVRMGQSKTLPLNFFFTGKGGVRVELSDDRDWLDTDYMSFVGKDQTVNVTINAGNLEMGTQKASIRFRNDFKSGVVEVTVQVKSIIGDTNSDFVVDDADFANLVSCYGTRSDEAAYQSDCDFNDDNFIDFEDVLLLAKFFGRDARKEEIIFVEGS
jgi:M6 family metalloprotease-like protein